MKLKNKILAALFLFVSSLSIGQMETYSKKMELKGITDQWHHIHLPNELFGDLNTNLTDIRIYGITPSDTIEAPYLLTKSKGADFNIEIPFNLLNTVSSAKGYYFTYRLPSKEVINLMKLQFANTNFDWRITLEGSQDQKEWYTLLRDYRILSIKNEQTNYSFTDLKFPDAQFEYYRLIVDSTSKPVLQSVKITQTAKTEPELRSYPKNAIQSTVEKKNMIIDIDLKQRVPVSRLEVKVADTIDYYRTIEIAYLADSVQTEKGIHYTFRPLGTFTLSSLEPNNFELQSTLTQKIRLTILNNDNEPLKIDDVAIKGFIHTLTARFTEPAAYFLVYGKKRAKKPNYDIANTPITLPDNLKTLELGSVQTIPKIKITETSPLFKNKWWLWGIIGIVVLVLGGFTLTMMKSKAEH